MPDHPPASTGQVVMQPQPVAEMVPAGGQIQAGTMQGAPAAVAPPQG